MSKWARIDSDNVIVATYEVETPQVIDKEIVTEHSLQELIGMIYVDKNTVRPDLVRLAREWRDEELRATDWIVPATDHPQHAAYLTYRQALRDWPSTADFPDTRPVLG